MNSNLLAATETKIMATKLQCPNCNKKTSISAGNLFRPFCSKRCREIDLGVWASEKYTISQPQSELPIKENNAYNE